MDEYFTDHFITPSTKDVHTIPDPYAIFTTPPLFRMSDDKKKAAKENCGILDNSFRTLYVPQNK
jgi:hypothetical protein